VPGTLDVKVSVKKLESVVRLPDGADRISVALIPPGVTDRRTRRAMPMSRPTSERDKNQTCVGDLLFNAPFSIQHCRLDGWMVVVV